MRGLAVVVALLLLPAAAADLQLGLTLDTDVVRPGLTSANATVTVSLDCPQVLARTGVGQTAVNVEVPIERTGAAGVTWSGPSVLLLPVDSCMEPTTERSSVTATYLVGLEGNGIPALTPQASRVQASIPQAAPAVLPAETAEANFTLQVPALPVVQVEASQTVVAMTGPTAQVPLRFTNRGNVAVTLEAKSIPLNATKGGTLTIPPVELALGATQDVEATFQAPAGDWSSQVMALEVTPVAQGGERGATLRVEVLFKAPTVDETAPLPASGLLALTLLGAALVARRRA